MERQSCASFLVCFSNEYISRSSHVLCRVSLCVHNITKLFYIIMALNCLVNTIKCNTAFTFYAPTRPIMENVNESHDKPPTTNVETSSPSLQTEDP
jgi:hypothetical protein